MAGELLLSVQNLTVAFAERTIIRDLSFDLHRGDTLAIIGPNGSGKTVLLKALLGLLPYTGNIRWSPGARLGYVPQKVAADRQMPLLVRDLLEAKARFLKLPLTELDAVSDLIGLLPDLLTSGIGVISGGQFQKVLIAYALLGKPNVLLFDEPTASLDELEEERIYDLVEKLQQSEGLTTLLISHDLTLVHHMATLVLCLSKGGACIGSPDKVLTKEILEAAYSAPQQYYQHLRTHLEGQP